MYSLQISQNLTPWIVLYGAQLKKTPITVPVIKNTQLMNKIKTVEEAIREH